MLMKFEFHFKMASLPVDDTIDLVIWFGQVVDIKMAFDYVLKITSPDIISRYHYDNTSSVYGFFEFCLLDLIDAP